MNGGVRLQTAAPALPLSLEHLRRLHRKGALPWIARSGGRLWLTDWREACRFFSARGADINQSASKCLPVCVVETLRASVHVK